MIIFMLSLKRIYIYYIAADKVVKIRLNSLGKIVKSNALCVKYDKYYIMYTLLTTYRINITEDVEYINYLDGDVYYKPAPPKTDVPSFDYILYYSHLKRFRITNEDYLNKLLGANHHYNIRQMLKYYD